MSLRDDIAFEYPLRDGPLWCCGACGTGRVTLITFQVLIQETPISIGGRLGEGAWDPDDVFLLRGGATKPVFHRRM